MWRNFDIFFIILPKNSRENIVFLAEFGFFVMKIASSACFRSD